MASFIIKGGYLLCSLGGLGGDEAGRIRRASLVYWLAI
jgi:hypothetical protein